MDDAALRRVHIEEGRLMVDKEFIKFMVLLAILFALIINITIASIVGWGLIVDWISL